MNTPPFLLAAAALFWGSQSGQWLVAVVAAVLMEWPRLSRRRWPLQDADFNRIADVCLVLGIGLALYQYFTYGNPRAITQVFLWAPVVLLPVALASAWSTSRGIALTVLFWGLRFARNQRRITFNPGYVLFALWLLAASAANQRGALFYAGVTVLAAWALWQARPRSHPAWLWAAAFLFAAGLGYAGQSGLNTLQLWLQEAAPEWLAGGGTQTNPYRNSTDIGTLGELKLSEGTVLRVEAAPALRIPLLLHRASYDTYRAGTWIARNGRFTPVEPGVAATSWKLGEAAPREWLKVYDYSPGGKPVLSLPAGTVRIDELGALELARNALGAVQAETKPGYFSYMTRFDAEHRGGEGPPTPADLQVPRQEDAVVNSVAATLQLGPDASASPDAALEKVRHFFATEFTYALWQRKPSGEITPLAEFLLNTRAGHCEYFATATTLLLRAAGIPARYATGFSVQEPAAMGTGFVVRERHAHAWTRAWVDGRWQDIDTTPAGWYAAEAENVSALQPLLDAWSWMRFKIARASEASGAGDRLLWLLLPLGAWLGWRIWRARHNAVSIGSRGTAIHTLDGMRGADSEFFRVERRLAELGAVRARAEAWGEWLARLRRSPQGASLGADELEALVALHSRHRFDPAGMPALEREHLRRLSDAWLARHTAPQTRIRS
jgi:transglutaminase-like putative cysteine protease